MTRQQRTALANVALIAEECANPLYGRRNSFGSVVLTVNAGYE